MFLALLLCITKQGSCEQTGVEWLDFGAKAFLVVFLLPFSLFALSPCLTTPSEQTDNMPVDFLIFVSHLIEHLGILIYHYLVSFTFTLNYMKDRQPGPGARVGKERGEGSCGEA